jgi:thymidylate synthase (FAD)
MLDVVLIDYARDPLEKLYGAYRTCYTTKTPREVWMDVSSSNTVEEKVTKQKEIKTFVQERLKTGHVSPLEQVVFWFGISGVSRALSHQFVRHRIGISFEQQSQRYVKYKSDGQFEFVTPPSIKGNPVATADFMTVMETVQHYYKKLCDQGIPNEDARFVLPNAMPTNFQVMVNLAEMLHICDLRLCHRAQWEIRKMVSLMRAEVKKVIPEIAAVMQPKCGERRMGYCDEDHKAYEACPLSKVRPHKEDLFQVFNDHYRRMGCVDDAIKPLPEEES